MVAGAVIGANEAIVIQGICQSGTPRDQDLEVSAS